MEGKGREEGFPPTPEAAIELAPAYDQQFVVSEWMEAAARGGRDYKMREIGNWCAYLGVQKEFRANKPQSSGSPAPKPCGPTEGLAPWRRLELLQQELDDVNDKLARFLRYNPDINPVEHAAVEKQKAPLRARRDELKQLIAEFSK